MYIIILKLNILVISILLVIVLIKLNARSILNRALSYKKIKKF